MDESLIFEKYLTEIAFTQKHILTNKLYLVFWIAENFEATVEMFESPDIDTSTSLLCFGICGGEQFNEIKHRLESKSINIFYALDNQKDSQDLTMFLVGTEKDTTLRAAQDLNRIYEESKDYFFKILKVNGFRVK
jgi:hypothetical protein